MICVKCKKEISDDSVYCNFCGKKQTAKPSAKYHKREHGTGTIVKDKRYKKQWLAYGPSTRFGNSRVYLGCFETRNEAKEAIDQFIADGMPRLIKATLADVYKAWSAAHYQTVSDSAVKLYTSMWKRFNSIQDAPVKELRTVHFQEIINTGTSASACSILKIMAVMMCNYAMENDIIQKNYADFVTLPKFEKKEKRVFSEEERAKLWQHSDDKYVQAILFMIYTGLRIGEFCKLTPESVHLDEGYIVSGSKTDAGKNRVIPIPQSIPELSEFLREWLSVTPENTLFFNMTSVTFRVRFYDALKLCGIDSDSITPHSTRHTFASLSSAAGMRAENLQKIIGHANFNTTAEIYIHQDINTLREEMAKIQK